MKIAVITFHRAYNCGAMLKAWALFVTLKKPGHEVKFLASSEIGRIVPCSPWSWRNRKGTLVHRVRSAVCRAFQTLCGKVEGIKTRVIYDNFRELHLLAIRRRAFA